MEESFSADRYTYIFFDLDGTITNPMLGITSCVAYALSHYGIEVEDLKTLCPFIGPPLKDSFMEYYHFSEQQAVEAIAYYRERFSTIGLFENEVYEGIADFLTTLRNAGKKIFLVTSKPTCYAEQILVHFKLSTYFDFVGGSNLDGTRTRKEEVMQYVLSAHPHILPQEVVMIGDRRYDIEAAQKYGITSVGVLYGFGSREELEDAGANFLTENIEQLKSLFF